LLVDYDSVTGAVGSVTAVAATLGGAPGGAALRTVEMSLAGGLLAAAAGHEAAEWKREMSGLIDSLERYTSA